ncbi:NAD-dependent epimerase/dehydratase family protein [Anaerobacillus isosaccharinicus]|uniref:Epimerase n=1 Tax=Anaerobacillus isosaccharinicus TaxID=1532552 RepID=A0A1S2M8J5_9BACI|nr:NAD-dependent epimerase/dehydratase family protein [Anaerobacillus isosaccharinicus]MBA5587611.1 NAD-dependent epimerase/dehydratase family protein [Anaerobacillus isosaccharinicus]QOY34212.1 NAD-dependent epimerase/dehydratase family protein [Anaerobacillus isosaccharinicus]
MNKLGNVLVTGGAGFLGSQLVLKFLELSDHIWVLDDLSTGKKSSVPSSSKVTFIEGSILDESLLKPILPKVNYIFHFACANLVNSVTDINRDFSTNLLGSFKMLQYAKEHCTSLKRFIYASTASVYSQAERVPTKENYHNIKLPYPASKFSAEHYMQVFYHLYQLPVTTLRFSNVYGPGQLSSNPYCGVVAKFFEAVLANEPLVIYGDGSQTRDFTFVADAMEAVLAATVNPKALGSVYNVGTGMETSVNELAEKVVEITNFKGKTVYSSKRTVDIVNRRCVSINLIKKDLGWVPETSLTQGLLDTYYWLTGGGG